MEVQTDKTHINTIEQGVALLLALLEHHDILEDLLIDRHTVVVTNGIFTEEIEDEEIRVFTGNVLETQRAAADGVRLVVILLVTRSKRELVDEIHGCGPLTDLHDLGLEFCVIVSTDAIDVFLTKAN